MQNDKFASAEALVILAPGCEEMEAIIPIDLLRRAGIAVFSLGLDGSEITASRGTRHLADATLDDYLAATPAASASGGPAAALPWIILPGGGPGTEAMLAHQPLLDLIARHHLAGGSLAAICAAPAVLRRAGVIAADIPYTCYPGSEALAEGAGGELASGEKLVVSQRLITANGPGSAFEFGLALISALRDTLAAEKVRSAIFV